MSELSTKAYGEGRIRTNIAYADVERAAIAILKAERRPTVETVREALGRGSPDTIAGFLRRVWRDLGARMEGDPAALTRMPTEIAGLADGRWQRALKLASEAAKNEDNQARERLEQIQIENDIRAQSFALREAEWDTTARERERALVDSREHLLLSLKTLGREQATLQARDARIADLEAQVEQYRSQLAAVIAGAVVRNRARARHKAKRTIVVAPVRRQSAAALKPRSGKRAKNTRVIARMKPPSAHKQKAVPKSPSRRGR